MMNMEMNMRMNERMRMRYLFAKRFAARVKVDPSMKLLTDSKESKAQLVAWGVPEENISIMGEQRARKVEFSHVIFDELVTDPIDKIVRRGIITP